MSLKYSDQVQINCHESQYHGMEGRVVLPGGEKYSVYTVEFANGERARFSRDRLVPLVVVLSIATSGSGLDTYCQFHTPNGLQAVTSHNMRVLISANFVNESSQSNKAVFAKCIRAAADRLEDDVKQ